MYRWHGRDSLDNPIWKWLAYRLPRPVLYWGLIRAGVKTIRNDEEVPAVPFVEVLKRV